MKKKSSKNITEIQQIIHYFENISQYDIDYEVESFYACQNGSDCCDHDYCRCRVIKDVKFNPINVSEFIQKNFSVFDKFKTYAIDRILRHFDVLNNFNYTAGRGYYGEEIHDIFIDDDIKKSTIGFLSSLENISNIDIIKKLLMLEYQFESEFVTMTTQAKIISINVKDITFPNKNHIKKIKNNIYDKEDYQLPFGIVKETSGSFNYDVIDGYHRLLSAVNKKKEKVDVILLEI